MLNPELVLKAKKIHDESVVVCMHTDLIGDVAERHSLGEHGVLSRRQADLFKKGGINCVSDHVIGDTFETQAFPSKDLLHSLWGGKLFNPSHVKHAMKILSYMLDDIDESSKDFTVATSVADIRKAAEEDRVAVVLCFQGLGPLEDEPPLLSIYHRLGIRVVDMAVARGNAAVGARELKDPNLGLTRLGREFLDEAYRLKMVMDVGAIPDRAFFDILEGYDTPVIASANNAQAVFNHPGNLRDEKLKALAQKGGVVGPIANNNLVTDKRKKPTLADYVDHIDHMVQVMGIDHVGFGPDIVEDSWYPLETYRRMFKDIGYWSCLYPDDFENHSQLPNVTAELLSRGYTESDVKKILGENILRVYQKVWGC
ncbi:MAG: hypothetical protein HKM93_02345 [Desulfobacteraceae bacterium]|nr:hypothetical protein [Desulfobacteraceae bacterium]